MGVNMQASTNLNRYLNLRASGNFFNYTANNISTNGFNLTGKVNMATAGVSLDIFPSPVWLSRQPRHALLQPEQHLGHRHAPAR